MAAPGGNIRGVTLYRELDAFTSSERCPENFVLPYGISVRPFRIQLVRVVLRNDHLTFPPGRVLSSSIEAMVFDRDSGSRISISGYREIDTFGIEDPREVAIDLVRKELLNLAAHEIAENLLVDGRLASDPHRAGGR